MSILPDWLTQWCRKLADGLVPMLSFFSKVFNPLIGVILAAYEFWKWVWSIAGKAVDKTSTLSLKYEAVKAWVGSSVFSPFPEGVQASVAFANSLFPITECLILMGLLAALYIAAAVVRLIKSFIPTMAT